MPFTSEQNKLIADLVFPEVHETLADLDKRYPKRDLPEGAMVTRVAPSPTGFMHLGTLYTSLICARVSAQSKGVFILRLEDTDQKRTIPGAMELIIQSLQNYEIHIDEGPLDLERDKGVYGPYIQSKRADIYKVAIKYLLEQGLAYPCFMGREELELMEQQQTQLKVRPGVYGRFAKWRHASAEEVIAKLQSGAAYEVIRFRNPGSERNRRQVVDIVKGKMQLPETDNDIVLMKSSDGLPVYHLAHAVDDHYMWTTHVIRGDEWLSSMMLHHQLFEAFGWPPPEYAHIGPIQKLEDGNRRKLSKRKDPESNVLLYDEVGYPRITVIEYLLNIANSSFEDWRKANPTLTYRDFEFKLSGLGKSGALIDPKKIENISKNIIGRFSTQYIYDEVLKWSNQFDTALAEKMTSQKDYVLQILNIERDGVEARKDIAKWSDVKNEISYFFDDWFTLAEEEVITLLGNLPKEIVTKACQAMIAAYLPADDKDTWIKKLKDIAESLGYAREVKMLKENPSQYQGHFGDIAKIYRVYLTGRNRSPDLYWVMKVLGVDKVKARLERGLR